MKPYFYISFTKKTKTKTSSLIFYPKETLSRTKMLSFEDIHIPVKLISIDRNLKCFDIKHHDKQKKINETKTGFFLHDKHKKHVRATKTTKEQKQVSVFIAIKNKSTPMLPSILRCICSLKCI